MPQKLKIGLVQQSCASDRDANVQKSITGIRDAAKQGAQLVLLQELHAGLYFCQTEDHALFNLAESIPGPSTDTFGQLAKELNIVIVTSLFERRAAGLYHNTAVVLESDGSIAGKYRKMHIPDDPGFGEKFYFTPGDLGFTPIETSVGKLGVLICWDQWFPEGARLMALAGAEILLYPTAIGWIPEDNQQEQLRQQDAWITVQRSHSITNGIPVVVANRTGVETSPKSPEDNITFWGSSFITGTRGEILSQASVDKEQVLVAEIEKADTESIRQYWPYFRDRRIDAYADLTKRYID